MKLARLFAVLAALTLAGSVAAQDATPDIVLDIPDPTECRIPVRPEAEVLAIVRAVYATLGTPTPEPRGPLVVEHTDGRATVTVDGVPWVVDGEVLPDVPFPTAEGATLAAVEAALWELDACDNAGDQRFWSLLSDANIARAVAFLAESGMDQARAEEFWLELVASPPRPRDPGSLHTPPGSKT